jgi:hypothetical protein
MGELFHRGSTVRALLGPAEDDDSTVSVDLTHYSTPTCKAAQIKHYRIYST